MYEKNEKVVFTKEYQLEVMGMHYTIPKGVKAIVLDDNDLVVYLLLTDHIMAVLEIYGENGHEVSLPKDEATNPYNFLEKR